jgi:hypothetical protein
MPTPRPIPTTSSSDARAPLSCLLDAYDQAIAACRAGNPRRAYRTITLLREAHPCDSPAAAGFDGLYAWCERCVLSGDYLGAARTLEQLRGAWESADRITSVPVAAVHRASRISGPERTAQAEVAPSMEGAPLR